MKKLVLLSLMFVGSSYAMDPTNPETGKRTRTIAKSGEHEEDQFAKKTADDVRHNKFCMEMQYSAQECRCAFARVKSTEKIASMLKYLTSSKE